MARKPIPETTLEAIRQEYLGGCGSLANIAKQHGVSRAVIMRYSSERGWAAEKKTIDEKRPKQDFGPIIRSADTRAQAVERRWADRFEGVVNDVGALVEEATRALRQTTKDGADFRDLATYLKLLADTLEKLQRSLPGGETGQGAGIEPGDIQKARERLLKRLTREEVGPC